MTHKKRAVRRDAGRPRGAPIADAVLRSTLVELSTAGLDGLSVERIAARAEVNKTSIYRRWPTRDALVVAALEYVTDDLAAYVPDTGSLRGDLLALVQSVGMMVDSPLGRALVSAALSESLASSVAVFARSKLQQQAASPVRALVLRAQERGEWRAGVQGDQVVFMLVGAIVHRAMMEHGALSSQWFESLVDVCVAGVLPRA